MHFIILFLIIMSCTHISPEVENLNRVTHKAVKKVENRFNLVCEGTGSSIPEKITKTDFVFVYSTQMTIEEGRVTILDIIDTLIETFKQDCAIQDYIQEKPINFRLFDIFLFSKDYENDYTPPGLLSGISFVNGKFLYKRYDLESKSLVTIFQETYEEALQKCAL